MNPYLEIIRPKASILGSLGVLVGSLIAGFTDPFIISIACLVTFLVSGAGMISNDYYDYNIDKVNQPKRPLPSGRISKRTAIYYMSILYILAIVLAGIFLNTALLLLAVLNVFVTLIYAYKIKARPTGHFIESWLPASTFLFGGLLSNVNVPVIILVMMGYCGSMGREIAKGIEDFKGDEKAGARTMEVVLGRNFAWWLAITFNIMAVLMSFLPFMMKIFSINYVFIILAADLMFAYASFIMLMNPKRSQTVMKIAMFVAMLAFLIDYIIAVL